RVALLLRRQPRLPPPGQRGLPALLRRPHLAAHNQLPSAHRLIGGGRDAMAKPRTASKRRLLATIDGPPRTRVYRAAFRPFESTKYLDTRALAKVRKATIEIGTLEV